MVAHVASLAHEPLLASSPFDGLRAGAMMARLLAFPASIIARPSGTEQVTMSRPPAARSCMAGAAPFEGTQAT